MLCSRMAFHHVVLFFTIIFLWHILANAQISSENQKQYMSPEKSRNLFLHQPIRSTRKISQRAFQDLDLFTARGYGKRAYCPGGFCGKRMPALSVARLYGKRNGDFNQIKWQVKFFIYFINPWNQITVFGNCILNYSKILH